MCVPFSCGGAYPSFIVRMACDVRASTKVICVINTRLVWKSGSVPLGLVHVKETNIHVSPATWCFKPHLWTVPNSSPYSFLNPYDCVFARASFLLFNQTIQEVVWLHCSCEFNLHSNLLSQAHFITWQPTLKEGSRDTISWGPLLAHNRIEINCLFRGAWSQCEILKHNTAQKCIYWLDAIYIQGSTHFDSIVEALCMLYQKVLSISKTWLSQCVMKTSKFVG